MATGRMTASRTAGTGPVATWEELYRRAVEGTGEAQEARWIIEEASGERWGAASGRVPEKARDRVLSMIERRRSGEPLQYVLGSWSFRTLDLMVDRRVLIPRPETEQVVEVALAELDRLCARPDGPARPVVVDLGTGSGAIALSVAAERRGVEVWATDASAGAAAVARANLAGLAGRDATRVRIVEGDWWAALPADLRGRVDLVVSNPPYISTAEMATLDDVVAAWEPHSALEGGPAGTEPAEAILAGAGAWLRPGGSAVIEIAPHQAEQLCAAALAAGFATAHVEADLAGRPRALVARLPAPTLLEDQ